MQNGRGALERQRQREPRHKRVGLRRRLIHIGVYGCAANTIPGLRRAGEDRSPLLARAPRHPISATASTPPTLRSDDQQKQPTPAAGIVRIRPASVRQSRARSLSPQGSGVRSVRPKAPLRTNTDQARDDLLYVFKGGGFAAAGGRLWAAASGGRPRRPRGCDRGALRREDATRAPRQDRSSEAVGPPALTGSRTPHGCPALRPASGACPRRRWQRRLVQARRAPPFEERRGRGESSAGER